MSVFHPSYHHIRCIHISIGWNSKSHITFSLHVNLEGDMRLVEVPEDSVFTIIVKCDIILVLWRRYRISIYCGDADRAYESFNNMKEIEKCSYL